MKAACSSDTACTLRIRRVELLLDRDFENRLPAIAGACLATRGVKRNLAPGSVEKINAPPDPDKHLVGRGELLVHGHEFGDQRRHQAGRGA
jgi:hypothetical protein